MAAWVCRWGMQTYLWIDVLQNSGNVQIRSVHIAWQLVKEIGATQQHSMDITVVHMITRKPSDQN